jgi:hypothetical protein
MCRKRVKQSKQNGSLVKPIVMPGDERVREAMTPPLYTRGQHLHRECMLFARNDS